MVKLSGFFTLVIMSVMGLKAQDLSKHQWQDRLVLIIAEDENNEKFQLQIIQLQNQKPGLKERKVIIYQILPVRYNIGFQKKSWENSAELYKKYKQKNNDFQVILIGLDGGKKLEQTKLLSTNKLFNTIDSMPMRQNEMRQNPKK